ncbi:MAG: pilus assembly protein PilM, partial [Patescibacteria group bacterium]
MLGLTKPYFLGVDFGTSSIKAVELTLKQGKPYLSNFGQVDLTALEKGELFSQNSSYDQELVLYLRALLSRLKPKSGSASVAMPAFIGLISLIEFPEMEEKELEEAIQFEAHKYIPSPLQDIALSWDVVGIQPAVPGNSARMEVLLVAALKKEVERYRGYVEAVDLKMDFLELETFSLVRSTLGDEPGLRMVIDIGSRATNLVLVESGVVRVSRNLDTGGKDLTRTLMEGLDITQERA